MITLGTIAGRLVRRLGKGHVMPLKKGSSKATRQGNIREMVRAGHPVKQAAAAAYRQQRSSAAKKGARKRKK